MELLVDCDGSVAQAVVTRGIGNGCDATAVVFAERMQFEPGRSVHGEPIAVRLRYDVVYEAKQEGD